MLAIVVSRADSASGHIGDHLLDVESWTEHEDDRRSDAEGGGTYYRTHGAELRTFGPGLDVEQVVADVPGGRIGAGDDDGVHTTTRAPGE